MSRMAQGMRGVAGQLWGGCQEYSKEILFNWNLPEAWCLCNLVVFSDFEVMTWMSSAVTRSHGYKRLWLYEDNAALKLLCMFEYISEKTQYITQAPYSTFSTTILFSGSMCY